MGGDRRRADRRGLPVRRARASSGSSCCCSSSTTSCRAPRSRGCTARRSGTTPRSPRELRPVIIDAAPPALSARVTGSWCSNAAPHAATGCAGRWAAGGRREGDAGGATGRPRGGRRPSRQRPRLRVVIDARGLLISLVDYAPRARGDRAGRGRATCCSCTATCPTNGTRGTSTSTTAGRRRARPRSTTIGLDAARGRPAVVVIRRSSASSTIDAADHAARPDASAVDRQRHRLARAAEVAQARVPARRARRPVAAETQFGHVCRADPRQHVVGCRALRDVRAPLGARRRTRVRRRDRERVELRLRRAALDARAMAAPRRPRGCRCCAAPRSPTRSPTRAGTRAVSRPRGGDDRAAVQDGYRINLRATRGAAARRAARRGSTPGRARRVGQAGGGPQRRRHRAPLRVPGRTRRR